jgi:DNA-binding HxlR family transcriptional regulator
VIADVYARACPSRQLLDRIGDTWSVLVVTMLADGPRRYTELARKIDGVSPKMLTRTLYPVVPPRVDYALTTLGESLLGLVTALEQWAEGNIAEVESARAEYDARDQAYSAR